MKRAVLAVLGCCLWAGTVSAGNLVPGSPAPAPSPARFIRVEGIAIGGLYETRDRMGACSGRLGKVTCMIGRARVGVSYLDGFGRPKSMNEGNSVIEMLWPLHAGVSLLSHPRPIARLGGLLPEAYAEAVVGPWNQRDAHYKYEPNARLTLGCGIGGDCLGVRAELGYVFGRDAFYTGVQLHGLTFDIPF
jgi:hypothetical protein